MKSVLMNLYLLHDLLLGVFLPELLFQDDFTCKFLTSAQFYHEVAFCESAVSKNLLFGIFLYFSAILIGLNDNLLIKH